MTLNIEQIRKDTPGCDNKIHFNNAGASLVPQKVLDTVINYLRLESELGGYEAFEDNVESIEQVYHLTAQLINAKSDEIALLESATVAWDRAFHSIKLQAGDTIITGMNEYASNVIAMLQMAKQKGVNIEVIPNDEYGQIDLNKLTNRIDNNVKLVALTHVPTNGGLINPAEKVGALAKDAGICYLLDACQSVGQLPIDVESLNCDILTATGRKYIRGPRGSGFLYVRGTLLDKLEPLCLDLHSASWDSLFEYSIRNDAKRFETWEHNVAARLGFGAAVAYIHQHGIESIWLRIKQLADLLRQQLGQIKGVSIHDLGERKCGIVSFSVDSNVISATDLRKKFRQQNINISTSSQYGARFDMESRGLQDIARASVHYYNTEDEVNRFSQVLAELL